MEQEHSITWEYMILESFHADQGDHVPQRFELRAINGQAPEKTRDAMVNTAFIGVKMEKGKDYPFLDEYLQDLGKQGWEVCGSSADNFTLFLILKRLVRK